MCSGLLDTKLFLGLIQIRSEIAHRSRSCSRVGQQVFNGVTQAGPLQKELLTLAQDSCSRCMNVEMGCCIRHEAGVVNVGSSKCEAMYNAYTVRAHRLFETETTVAKRATGQQVTHECKQATQGTGADLTFHAPG